MGEACHTSSNKRQEKALLEFKKNFNEFDKIFANFQREMEDLKNQAQELEEFLVPQKLQEELPQKPHVSWSPVSQIHNLNQEGHIGSPRYERIRCKSHKFAVMCTIDGLQSRGYGATWNDARQKAADVMLTSSSSSSL